MKKILLSFAFALMGLTMSAQDDMPFIFVDADGKEVPDGSVVNVTELEDDGWDIMMHSGLYVKNISDEGAYAGMLVDIKRMDSGALQHCFPNNCYFYSKAGEYVPNGGELLPAGFKKSIQSEWAIDDSAGSGLCTVVYTIRLMAPGLGNSLIEVDFGPSVTVNYCNGIFPDGIIKVAATDSDKIYNLHGQQVDTNYHGIVIKNGKKTVQ